MIRLAFSKLLVVIILTTFSQIIKCQTTGFYNPIALPPSISGSFGEIRSDHFHSGVDFRTNGKTGFRVYSSEKGYVSRIKVSAVGFGKTVYIDHPNGFTTVYAHLDGFSKKITQYVENAQYSLRSFEVELFPEKNEILIEKGEIIGFSGNSGSSGGPHLHYEIRYTSSQIPMAPLKHFENWKNTDTSAPTLNKIYIYQIDSINYLMDSIERKSLKFNKNRNNYQVVDTIKAYGRIGLGIESYDYVNENSNRCGFSEISLKVNDKITYKLSLDSFAFAETKYVNSIIDYGTKIITNEEVVQLWVDDNNKFSGLNVDKSKGFITIENNKVYNISIDIEDHAGNTANLKMIIKGFNVQKKEISTISSKSTLLEFNKEHKISAKGYEIIIPKDALYHNLYFSHSMDSTNKKQPVYRIHNPKTPIHKRFTLRIEPNSFYYKYINKLYIGYINGKGIEFVDSKNTSESIEASCSKFGNYTLLIDTIPPQIKPINISNKQNLLNESKMNFQLIDETGINTYAGYIDNNWVLFEWDPKNKVLTHVLDNSRIKPNSWHSLKIEVSDKLNNKSEFSCDFFW